MPKYDVTFARTGSMTVEANSKEEAMRIANQTATVDTVNWCDDLSVPKKTPLTQTTSPLPSYPCRTTT